MTLGERIKFFRERKGLGQTELASLVNISKQSLYKYENNIITNIPSDKIEMIAKKLDTTPAILMGWESNVSPLPSDKIFMRPLYNSVAAGFGAPAENTIISYIPTFISNSLEKDKYSLEKDKYIWVNVEGDSMSPLIDDGSKILIRMQDSVDSGQIAIVLIDGEEAVVKKIEYGKDYIELVSINPYYPPRRFEGADVQRIRVVGMVKEVSKELQ